MSGTYGFHRVFCRPRRWREAGERIAGLGKGLEREGGTLYGVWRSQIGRPRDELTVLTQWDGTRAGTDALDSLLAPVADIVDLDSVLLEPTLRPESPQPPTRQGNYAFRWFTLPESNWPEFIELCAAAWPGFEASYDSQVIGLWREPQAGDGICRSLLLTRRPDLAMWERSKLPQGEDEAEVRRKLSRRYDLCDSTEVYTTTLLTAVDREDTARWT